MHLQYYLKRKNLKHVIFYIPGLIYFLLLNSGCAYSGTQNANMQLPEVNQRNLYQVVKTLTDKNPARNYYNIKSLNETASYIKKKFKSYGYKPIEQKYKVHGDVYKNIIASYGPVDAPRLIVGAHYDVCGDQPGADDNASAVAGLLETARLVSRNYPSTDYRIDFVAYTLEEPPHFATSRMGSYVHAQSLYENNVEVVGMICLEMIGYFSDEPNSQNYPLSLLKLFYPEKGNFIAVVSKYGNSRLMKRLKKGFEKTSIDVRTLKAPSFLTGIDFSDHRNYLHFGYKAVMVTDTSFYRNPNYHEDTDTIDTLDFRKMGEVVKGIYFTLHDICGFRIFQPPDSRYAFSVTKSNKFKYPVGIKGKWMGEYVIDGKSIKMIIKIGSDNKFISGYFLTPDRRKVQIKDLVLYFSDDSSSFTASLADQRGVKASLFAEVGKSRDIISGTFKDNKGYKGHFSLKRK